MFFQTNTTISLICSILVFLTKNTFCSGTQQPDPQNNTVVQKPAKEDGVVTLNSVIINYKTLEDYRLKLKESFTKEKYEKYLNLVDVFNKETEDVQRKYSSELTEEDKNTLADFLKMFQEMHKNSEEFFTVDVVDEKEKKKRINIIEEVKKSRKNKGLLKKVFIWGIVILVVLLLVGLFILKLKRRGD